MTFASGRPLDGTNAPAGTRTTLDHDVFLSFRVCCLLMLWPVLPVSVGVPLPSTGNGYCDIENNNELCRKCLDNVLEVKRVWLTV